QTTLSLSSGSLCAGMRRVRNVLVFQRKAYVNQLYRSLLINNNDSEMTAADRDFSLRDLPILKIMLLAVMAVTFSCLPSWAQVTSGTILGSVEDSSGAVVPGAQVTA